jgi:hypothetical protein
MKTITIEVNEAVYEDFCRASDASGRPISELIREALESYRRRFSRPSTDLRGFRPRSVGRVTVPLRRRDDLLGEMM